MNIGYSLILCGTLTTVLVAQESSSVIVVNRCCASEQIYDAVEDKCKPWPRAGGYTTGGNISGRNATNSGAIPYDPVSHNTFNLSEVFVKRLDGRYSPSQGQTFT